MPNRAPDQAMPGLPQTDVAGLAERIIAPRERIVTMVHEGLHCVAWVKRNATRAIHRCSQQPCQRDGKGRAWEWARKAREASIE